MIPISYYKANSSRESLEFIKNFKYITNGFLEMNRRGVNSMAIVKVKEGETFESAMRRFKKQCEKAGILSEVRKREHYEKPSVKLKKKRMAARKRALKKQKKFVV